MTKYVDSPYLVPFDGSFDVRTTPTAPDDYPGKKACKKALKDAQDELEELQEVLYASDYHSVLLVFQAMDAAGKDSTIRAVMSGVNPAGCQVFSFKQPSSQELDHDFLWRTAKSLPERGRIGIFNRSYYEEVLVVKVHPEYLKGQKLGTLPDDLGPLWQGRYASIREHEAHLARNKTVILKFFLNVGRDEQKQRFLDRIDEPDKNWKFSYGDVKERRLWPKYMQAYEQALNETSRPWAPWYAIPADKKPFMRLQVAKIIVARLEQLGLKYPELSKKETKNLQDYREELENEPPMEW